MDQQPPLPPSSIHHPVDVAFLPFSSTDADHDDQPADDIGGVRGSSTHRHRGTGGSGYGDGHGDGGGHGDGDGGSSEVVNEIREETEGEVRRIIGEIEQLLHQLHSQTSTHYLLLLSPPFRPTTAFPHLLTTPSSLSYWHSLRGGPQSNLAKFLALSIPTTTTKRLAIPEGERSLDVKARLNALMRRMVRDVSGKEEAEMKWTKPETLIGNYGVKVVGWPGYKGLVSSLITPDTVASTAGVGGDGREMNEESTKGDDETTLANAQSQQQGDKLAGEEEWIPLRNPSNNTVKIYITPATTEDRRIAELCQNAGAGGGAIDAAIASRDKNTNVERTPSFGDHFNLKVDPLNPLDDPSMLFGIEEETEGEYLPSGSSGGRGGRKRRLIIGNGMSSKRPRSKPVLTMEPGGMVRLGPLEGRRKPGRPRKSSGGEEGDSVMEPSEGHDDIVAGVVNQVNQQQEQQQQQHLDRDGMEQDQLDRNGMDGLNDILMNSEMGVGITTNGYEFDEDAVDPARTLAAMSGILSHRQLVDGFD